jgi:hypothetical protein
MSWLGALGGDRRRLFGMATAVLALLGLDERAGARRGKGKRLRRIAACATPADGTILASGGASRKALVFTPLRRGSLRRVQFGVLRNDAGADYVVQVLRAPGGAPSIKGFDVIAATVVPDTSIPEDEPATLTATFAGPTLEANETYAAVISRPVAGLNLVAGDGTDCPTVLTADGNDPVSPFITGGAVDGVLFAVFVAR